MAWGKSTTVKSEERSLSLFLLLLFLFCSNILFMAAVLLHVGSMQVNIWLCCAHQTNRKFALVVLSLHVSRHPLCPTDGWVWPSQSFLGNKDFDRMCNKLIKVIQQFRLCRSILESCNLYCTAVKSDFPEGSALHISTRKHLCQLFYFSFSSH